MRITLISDTHCQHAKVKLPGGDTLIHSGDFTWIGDPDEVTDFLDWFTIQPYANKVFIAGNHDLTFDSEILYRKKASHYYGDEWDTPAEVGKPDWLKRLLTELPSDTHYLETSVVEINGVKIWGSPHTPKFGREWGFNVERGYDINQIWTGIPIDTNIVVTHGPIYGYCDRVYGQNKNVGCNELYYRLMEVNPAMHVCGHIHEAYGYRQTDWGYALNASVYNHLNYTLNEPITVDYDLHTKEIQFI